MHIGEHIETRVNMIVRLGADEEAEASRKERKDMLLSKHYGKSPWKPRISTCWTNWKGTRIKVQLQKYRQCQKDKKPLMPACRDKRIQEDSVGKGPLAVQHLRHAAEMQGKKVWAKISAEEKSLSLVCSAQFAFHTRKQQHHIEFGLNQVLKNVHDSKLSLEVIILCVISPFQSLWFLKTFRVALVAFIEVQYQN